MNKGVGPRWGISYACCTHFWGEEQRKKARALDGRGMLQKCLPRADVPRVAAAWLPRLRASKGAEAWFVGAGRGACGSGPASPGRESAPKLLLSPDLCASRGAPLPPLPPLCACVYSSPSRRTPVDAAARTPRTGYCGRRRRSDRPFRTGLQKGGLRKNTFFHKPPSFMNSLNPFTFKL